MSELNDQVIKLTTVLASIQRTVSDTGDEITATLTLLVKLILVCVVVTSVHLLLFLARLIVKEFER